MKTSIITLNLWNTEFWDRRKNPIKQFLSIYHADIYCFQEVRPKTIQFLDEQLPSYQRVQGEEKGWTNEGTIYVNSSLYNIETLGCFNLEKPEKHRRFFYTKLWHKLAKKELYIGTVHFTHQGNADELKTGYSHRHDQAHRLIAYIKDTIDEQIPFIIAGDFNDPIHPTRILNTIGFNEIFFSLNEASPPTFPCPVLSKELFLVEAIDKITARGDIKAVCAHVPHFYYEGSPLSDHFPVVGVYEL